MSRIAFFIALAWTVARPASAQEVLRYHSDPGTRHVYIRTQEDRVTQTVNGQGQTVDIRSYWRFRTEVRDEGPASLTLEVVHDSLAIESTPAGSAPDFSGVYGQPLVVVLGERGEVREIILPESLPVGSDRLDLETIYRTFFPVLPAEPAAPGISWRDTVQVAAMQNGIDITVTRVNTYTAGGNVEHAGRDAVRIDYTSEMELAGRGSQQGAEISLSGSGTGSGAYFFAPGEGIYLGGTESTDLRTTAFIAAGGRNLLIPIVQTRAERIELVE